MKAIIDFENLNLRLGLTLNNVNPVTNSYV